MRYLKINREDEETYKLYKEVITEVRRNAANIRATTKFLNDKDNKRNVAKIARQYKPRVVPKLSTRIKDRTKECVLYYARYYESYLRVR